MKNKTVRKSKKYNNTKKRRNRNRNKRGGAEEECSICYEPINEDNKITTPCGHNFHKECILQTCKVMYWKKNNVCLCPLCRANIDTSMKQLLPPEQQFDVKHLTMETFPLYINSMLSAIPEENPDDTLNDLLLSFEGTDDLPQDVHDPFFDNENRQIPNIMQFKKMHVATRIDDRKPLYVYFFEGFVKKLPPYKILRRNKKYYAFVLDEDGMTELDILE